MFCCTILRCSKASIFGTDAYRCIVLQTTSEFDRAVHLRSSYNFHTRPCMAHANTDTLHAHPRPHPRHTSSASTGSPRRCHIRLAVPHPIPINIKLAYIHLRSRVGGKNETHKENGQGILLIALSKGGAQGGAGIVGLGPGIVSDIDTESETLSSPLLGRWTTLRPGRAHTCPWKVVWGKRRGVIFAVDGHRHPMLGSICGGVRRVPLRRCCSDSIYAHICRR